MENLIKVTTLSESEKNEMGHYIETYLGKRIYFDNIKIENISIIDIAHSLSHICRFTGHTKEFYSVAQHSVLVADHQTTLVEKRAGLLHDATECYLNDLASPLKKYLSGCGYSDLEDEFHHVINEKFDINGGMTPNIKKADLQALFTEKRDVLNFPDNDWGWGDDIERWDEVIVPLQPKEAKALFLKRFVELFPEFNIE
jgi:5'-deoxynucleotidase YfbR-like HD superfamily hydrolase